MNILISNDDGVFAPGIKALAQALKPLGRVVVVAPDSERSGFSSALTLDRPLKATQLDEDVWALNGTPADCVFLAANGLFEFEFDLVVSGINSGANLGDDVLYSGTVGAAFEGRKLKLPALAISLAGPEVRSYSSPDNFKAAAQWVHDFIQNKLTKLPQETILNINIPDQVELQGCQVTYQGQKQLQAPILRQIDSRGRDVVWISLAGKESNNGMNHVQNFQSDFEAVQNGYVSITPLHMNLTNVQILANLQQQIFES